MGRVIYTATTFMNMAHGDLHLAKWYARDKGYHYSVREWDDAAREWFRRSCIE